MRIIGAIFIFGLSYLIGSHDGVLGFLEAWTIIGVFAMVGSFVGLFVSLRMVVAGADALGEDPSEQEAMAFLKDTMSVWTYSGLFAFGLVGAIIANMVV
jgi:hypothetical protein